MAALKFSFSLASATSSLSSAASLRRATRPVLPGRTDHVGELVLETVELVQLGRDRRNNPLDGQRWPSKPNEFQQCQSRLVEHIRFSVTPLPPQT